MLGTEYNCSLHTIHVGLGIVSLVLYIQKIIGKKLLQMKTTIYIHFYSDI